jgi:hypothetical protein
MKTFNEFMSLCEATYDPEIQGRSQIKRGGAGEKIGADRKKTPAEMRRKKAIGGGKSEIIAPYKTRKDIGQQRSSETRIQVPTKERGSVEVRAKAEAAAKEERRKAAQARIAARKAGQEAPATKPKAKEVEKQATKLLSTKKPETEKPKPEAKPRRKWEHPGGGPMTRQERDQARNKEKTVQAQKTKKSATEILAQMRKEYEEGGGTWNRKVAIQMRAKAAKAAQASGS